MADLLVYYYAWLSVAVVVGYWNGVRAWSSFWVWWNGDDVMENQLFLRHPWLLDVWIVLQWLILGYMGMPRSMWWSMALLHAIPWVGRLIGAVGLSSLAKVGAGLWWGMRVAAPWMGVLFFGVLRAADSQMVFHAVWVAVWALYSLMEGVLLANVLAGVRPRMRGAAVLYFCTTQLVFFWNAFVR